MVRSIAIVLAMAHAPAAVAAEATAPPPRATPSAPPAYVSAFAAYQPWREPALVPWKQVNDEVARLGGHMGHLRGSAVASPPVSPPADPQGAKR